MRSTARMDGRVNVGLALASLHTGASLAAWPGVADAAARADVGLFCFPGGRIGLREGYEASRNAVYELAARAPLDGMLVWSSSLCGAGSAADLDRFVDRWRDIPAVSLSEGVSGIPVVTIDYYSGMRGAVLHAIEAHGYRRIAFARGPENHPGAEERYRAFLDIMGECGIEVESRLVASPSPWDSGDKAVLELLDGNALVPGRDFEALVAASDLMALSASRALQARGWRVPGDLAVIGMNNSLESRVAAPPMTTVDGPFAELGAEALRSLLASIRGEKLPPIRKLPARLVIRQSCGCPSSSFLLARASGPDASGHRAPAIPDAEALALLIAAEVGVAPSRARDWVAPLVEAWEGFVAGGKGDLFFEYLGRVMDRAMRQGIELGPWQGAVSLLRRAALPRLDAAGRERMEDLVGQARVLVAEATERALSVRAWERARREEGLRSLDHELLMALDMKTLGGALRASLPSLGIRSAYVCRYEGSDQARLAFGFRDGEELPSGDSPFPAADLLPRGAFPSRRLAYVVEPLFFHDSRIGYALFEIGDRAGELYEGLRDSVSNALRSVILFARVDDARAKAERADDVKSHLLTNVSHELRTPVDLILRSARRLLEEGRELWAGPEAASEARSELRRVKAGAEHQLRLVNDLLDLSRAEIDELDLDRAPLDPGPLLRETFELFTRDAAEGVEWRLELPPRLPLILADGQRIRQILMNLLGNAAKFTRKGSVALAASVDPPKLRITVRDTGPGIAAERLSHLFEPFVSAAGSGRAEGGRGGVGLGLSIARHLALLHFGELEVESVEGEGSTFVLGLPLPNLGSLAITSEGPAGGCVLVVSASGRVPEELAAMAARRSLEARRIRLEEIEAGLLDSIEPAALAWDMEGAGAEEWALFRKLRQRPRLAALPFLLFGFGAEGTAGRAAGSSAFLAKGAPESGLADALMLCCPPGGDEPVLVADDDAEALAETRAMVARALPGVEVIAAGDGEEAWEAALARPPRLAILDLMMPGLTGTDLVGRFRGEEKLRSVPILLMTNKVIAAEDLRAIEGQSRVVLQNKGVWTEDDARAGIARLAGGDPPLPAATSAIVKRCVAYMNRHYPTSVTRWKLAEAVNVSEDYLSRVFRRELGITPWEYLSRLRVKRAKELLTGGSDSVAAVGDRVGFPDQAYFSRVFRKIAGMSPQAFRESAGKSPRGAS